jgi:hypothetical protein
MSHIGKIYIFCLCCSIPIQILVEYQTLNSFIPTVFELVEPFLATKLVAERHILLI